MPMGPGTYGSKRGRPMKKKNNKKKLTGKIREDFELARIKIDVLKGELINKQN